MKKGFWKKLALSGGIGFCVLFLASCTANFCSDKDKANIMFSYDVGTSVYVAKESEIPAPAEGKKPPLKEKINDNLWRYQNFDLDYKGDPAKMVADVNKAADANKIAKPTNEYWFAIDRKLLNIAWNLYATSKQKGDLTTANVADVKECLNLYGYIKFSGDNNKLWQYWDEGTDELRKDTDPNHHLGLNGCPNADYTYIYKQTVDAKTNNVRSCIALGGGGTFGNFGYNHNKVQIEGKNWGYAWSRGFIEGLLVYPVAFMVESFSHSFGMSGWGQLGAILLVTFIVRSIIALVGFKQTLGQQKMQMLQPELAKIQAKYPNSNTNQAQKQRLAQEQMALYKKNKINPIGSLLVLVLQFPIFIGVWGAMQGSAALASDAVLNLHLSESIWNTLTNTAGLPTNVNGWWTAFGLFILMAVSQFVSMKLPQWIQKHREKKIPKLSANPAQSKSQKQMKWFGYIMLVFIIIMGFTLPAGMGVYWLAGALFSIFQTVITQLIISGTFKKWGHSIKSFFKKIKRGNNNENI